MKKVKINSITRLTYLTEERILNLIKLVMKSGKWWVSRVIKLVLNLDLIIGIAIFQFKF